MQLFMRGGIPRGTTFHRRLEYPRHFSLSNFFLGDSICSSGGFFSLWVCCYCCALAPSSVASLSLPINTVFLTHNHSQRRILSPQNSFASKALFSSPSVDPMTSLERIPEKSVSSFESFVTSRRNVTGFDKGDEVEVQFVIGNEAGDADSVVSALAWAYIMQQVQPDKHWVPIVSIPRADMCLRPDIRLLFQMCNNAQAEQSSSNWVESMIYIDDDDIRPTSQNLGLTLVDHNRKSNNLPSWFQAIPVTQIIDHHADEKFYTDTVDNDNRNIAFEGNTATVGSTCTLVVEKIMCHNLLDWMKDNKKDVALALLGVILLDTMNMNPDAGKGTERDVKAIQSLQKCVDVSNLQELFQTLQDAKFNSHFWKNELSARDTLRMDYKTFAIGNVKFGLSSVLLPMNDLIAKNNFKEHAIQYMTDLNISFLGILSLLIEDDKPPQRELLLMINNHQDSLLQELKDYLLNHEDAAFLKIKEHTLCEDNDYNSLPPLSLWLQQENPKGSRKQVAPVLLRFFDNKVNSN